MLLLTKPCKTALRNLGILILKNQQNLFYDDFPFINDDFEIFWEDIFRGFFSLHKCHTKYRIFPIDNCANKMKSKYDHQTKSIYSCFKQFLCQRPRFKDFQERMNLNPENTDNIKLFKFASGNPFIGTIRLTNKRL